MANGNVVDGYEFESMIALDEARSEAEKVALIRAEYDLSNPDVLKTIYDMYTASDKHFKTPVGMSFIREIQKRLARDPKYRKTMKPIPVTSGQGAAEMYDIRVNEIKEKYVTLKEKSKGAVAKRNIIIVFLLVLVIGLFAFEIISGRYESREAIREEVLDEYAGWAEELSQKEKELRDREESLKDQ